MSAQVTIDGYDVWGRLGGDDMSDVWLAKHVELRIPVIVKTINAEMRDALGARVADQRLFEEAQLMARVKNPRVVRAMGAGISGTIPYLVEEYIDGIDVSELDRRRRAAIGVGLPLWFVSTVMREVCDALHSAHQAGVVHRNVTPAHIFGSPDGIRLGNFGIAVARTGGEHVQASGTVKFMAPEQFGFTEMDRRVDAWGVGVTACTLRYGAAPFETVDEILADAVEPRLPRPISPDEASFQHTLRHLLEKSPEKRLGSCGEAARRFASLARVLTPLAQGGVLVERHVMRLGGCHIVFVVGDLADAKVDAIINSANSSMTMRASVSDVLRKRGGDEIEREAVASGPHPLGSCVPTTAGTLSAKHVLHAVSGWNEVSCVGRAIARALLAADELGCRTIAMPALGTGAGRVSIEMCAHATARAIRWHALLGGMRVNEVQIWLTDDATRRTFQAVTEEALHDIETRGHGDLGLAVDRGQSVRPDAATFIDTGSPASDPSSRNG